MRRILAAALAATTVLTAVAAAPSAGESQQEFSGTIALPNPSRETGTPVTRPNRSTIFAGSAAQGTIAHWFKVDPATLGGTFELTPTGGVGDVDLDIIFYSNPGSLTDAPSAAAEYMNAGTGESGIIPASATYAVIFPYSGVNVTFDYTGNTRPSINLSEGGDLTITLGQVVDFVNDTGEYGSVDGGEAFSIGTGDADGMRAGETSGVELPFGEFTYTTSAGASGTITVSF